MTNIPEFLFAGSAIVTLIAGLGFVIPVTSLLAGAFAAAWELLLNRPRKRCNRKVTKGVTR